MADSSSLDDSFKKPHVVLGPHLGHQEVERIIVELEQVLTQFPNEQSISVANLAQFISHNLGYEDVNELEDGLQGDFVDFLRALPTVVIEERALTEQQQKQKDEESSGKGKQAAPMYRNEERYMRTFVKKAPEPDEDDLRPMRLICRIRTTEDLWRVCLKSQEARAEIPEMEFEVGADGARKVDAIYNHISSAVFNLGTHVREGFCDGMENADEYKIKLMETCVALNVLLDVEHPWTWIITDPSGKSTFRPMEGVEVVYLDEPGASESKLGYENLGLYTTPEFIGLLGEEGGEFSDMLKEAKAAKS